MTRITDGLKEAILAAVKSAFSDVDIKPEDIQLEHPQAPEHGDYSTNIALKLAQKSGGKKSFLENIDFFWKELTEENYRWKNFALPLGRLNPRITKLLGNTETKIWLRTATFAKIRGWREKEGFSGHQEVTKTLFEAFPRILFYPDHVIRETIKNRYLLVGKLDKNLSLVVDIGTSGGENWLVTAFLTKERYLRRREQNCLEHKKEGITAGTAVSPILAPANWRGGGSRFSTLQDTKKFYNTLDSESQEQVLWYEEKLAPREIAERTIATMTMSDNINETKDKRCGTKDKIKDNRYGTKGIEKIEAAGGFINFTLAKEWLAGEVSRVRKEGEKYGRGESFKDKKIMVEFAHPNTHKAFHIGHLRNITLGESLVRLLEFSGAKVIRANYQGDVGLHVAKALWGVKKLREEYERVKTQSVKEKAEFLGRAYALGSQTFEANEEVKAEIGGLNRAIYRKDSKIMPLWQETRQWSLDYFDLIYQRVYTTFDRLYFEGEVAERGKELVLQNVGKIFKESDGAIIFPGDKFKLHNRVFINSEGNPTYEAKDMGLGELQFKEYNPDLLIHNLGPEQSGYMQVMFAALAQIFPKTRGREMHLPYGWVKLKEGKMSSRAGNVVLGEWLLDEIKRRIAEKYPNRVADPEPIAVAAAKYSLLKVGRMQEVAFDIDESISLEGDSGPYLQYTYARARSVIRKSEGSENSDVSESQRNQMVRNSDAPAIWNSDFLSFPSVLEPEELAILRYLYRFPEVVEAAAKQYAPNLVCSYLFELAKRFNNFYNNCPIISDDKNLTANRLLLTASCARVLKNGLTILGIAALERM